MPNLLQLFAGKIYIKENVSKKFMEKKSIGTYINDYKRTFKSHCSLPYFLNCNSKCTLQQIDHESVNFVCIE